MASPQNRTHSPPEWEALERRLTEAEDTLRAIREGDVDALLVTDRSGERLYTLQSADAPYRAFVEQMQEGAVTLGATGEVTYCNRRFAELAGVSLEHVIGWSFERFLDEQDRDALARLMTEPAGTLLTRLVQANGPSREVLVSLSTVSLGTGDSQRTLLVTDMSGVAKAQRESREKDEFLAMLAHELRNPLGAIAGAVQVLDLIELSEPRAIRARSVIERQVSHMSRLMDDLLDVGRVVTGKIVLDRRPVDLAQCAASSISTAASGLPLEGRIELDTQPVWISGDPVRLEQVIGNLVSNAIRFTTPDQAIRVSVYADNLEAVLSVSDDGVGIEPDLLPRVFDLFTQGDRSRDRGKGGLGIGLTLVKRLVELHAGTVEAFSAGLGRGSTFTVRMPRIAPDRVLAPEPQSERAQTRARVLLVDDNTDSREMYALMLQAEGHEVHQAADARSALEAFRRVAPQIAIVDIGLPGLNGHEFARRIRAEPSGGDVTLIALTGYGFPDDRERSRAAGFNGHLVKPVAPEDLRRYLKSAIV